MPRLRHARHRHRRGPGHDGQVLVFHDLLGIYDGRATRLVKRYADVREQMGERGVPHSPPTCASTAIPSPITAPMAPDEVERLHSLLSEGTGDPHRRSHPLSGGRLRFSTQGDGDIVDITAGVESVDRFGRGSAPGLISVCVPGATAAVAAMEYEPGGVSDLRHHLAGLVPEQDRLRARSARPGHQLQTQRQGRRSSDLRGQSPSHDGPARTRHLAAARYWSNSTVGRQQRTVLVRVVALAGVQSPDPRWRPPPSQSLEASMTQSSARLHPVPRDRRSP